MAQEAKPMGYKTILVHLTDKRRAEKLLEPACFLARCFGSHLIGLHVSPGISAPAIPVPGSGQAIGMALGAQRKESGDIAAAFTRMTANQPFTSEWHAVEALGFDLGEIVMRYACCVDLVVAGQADPDWSFSPVLDFPERLAVQSGRPILVVPYAGRYAEIGRNAVIAWKATREAARAVFDALPLLKSARNVQILEVKEDVAGAVRDTAIAAALSRHGIKAAHRVSGAADITTGDEILSRLADASADLLVMGAYGHSRMREFMLGGVTRHISQHMTTPTLWSH
jgi:nucleotide-binding universal stress UspA family protein